VQQLVAAADRDRMLAFLGAVTASDDAAPLSLRLGPQEVPSSVTGVMFRESRGAYVLLRLAPSGGAAGERSSADVMDQVPDPFVLTEGTGIIRAANGAFVELVGHGRADDLVGEPLTRFLGRPGVDPGLMASQLAEHGLIRHFPTVIRPRFGEQLDVEVSAVAAGAGVDRWVGYTLRTLVNDRSETMASLGSPRSVEELTDLVGRMSLKDIVRESTDLIERLCIEAALKCADNNRASAAEILGLSRQGLYLKLHRHGLARDSSEDRSE
jgi:transcriptional regulator PpsR